MCKVRTWMSILGVKGKGSWHELDNGSWSWNKGASYKHEWGPWRRSKKVAHGTCVKEPSLVQRSACMIIRTWNYYKSGNLAWTTMGKLMEITNM
jgi:hypothetical protein